MNNYNSEIAEAKIAAVSKEFLLRLDELGLPRESLPAAAEEVVKVLTVAFQQGGHMALHLTKMELDKHA